MRLLAIFSLTLWVTLVQSQTVIHHPDYATSAAPYVQLTKVELTPDLTRLSFTVTYDGDWIKIPSNTYIQTGDDTTKLYVLSGEGIEINQQHTMGDKDKTTYVLTFPAVNAKTTTINYGEVGGTWFINGIELYDEKPPNTMPKELRGGWYHSKTGMAEIAFFKNTAIYDNKVWSYRLLSLSKNILQLSNGKNVKTLYFKKIKPGEILLGSSLKNSQTYLNNVQSATIKNVAAYQSGDVLKRDTAIYEGYIANYTPDNTLKTGKVAVNNVFTSNQDSYTITVNEQGYFKVRIPLFYPEDVFVDLGNRFTVFLEPGKTLFHVIDAQYGDVYMGGSGQINREMKLLSGIKPPGYKMLSAKIASITAQQYKDFLLNNRDHLLDSLNEVRHTFIISDRAIQLKKIAIENNCTETLLSYNIDFEGHVRDKYRLKNYSDSLPEKPDKPANYYDFIDDTTIGDPVYLMSAGSYFLFNRLFFLDEARPQTGYSSLSVSSFMDLLQACDIATEKIAAFKDIGQQKKYINIPNKDLITPYEPELSRFFREQATLIRQYFKLFPTSKGYSPSHLLLFLKDSNVVVPDAMVHAYREYESSEAYKKMQELNQKESMLAQNLTEQYSALHSFWMGQNRQLARNHFYEQKLGLKNPLLNDIALSQEILKKVTSQTTPLSKEELSYFTKEIKMPVVAAYWKDCSDATVATIALQKNNSESKINELHNVEVKKVLEAITAKFRGKVIYIDFWATWCGPCISGIKEIASLKEALKEENVVFIYITDPSSPENTWKNMIAGINGEHFRVTENEWNYLAGFFNISGIPHYALVNKKGEILSRDLGHQSNDQLNSIFKKLLNE